MNNYPKVSFIIPTLDSSRTIKACLSSIINQDYDDLEIIVVDSYSKDDTVKIAREYSAAIYCSSQSYAECRQLGIEKANGEILACFDSDIVLPHPQWLRNAVDRLYSHDGLDVVWPLQMPKTRAPWLSRAYLKEQWGIIRHRVRKGVKPLGGSNALFRKSCIDKFVTSFGGFQTSLQTFDDFYLANKLMELNCRVLLYEDPVIHDTHIALREIINKQRERAKYLKTLGAEQALGIPLSELLYEYLPLSLVLAVQGVFKDKDWAALMVPLFSFLRGIVFISS
jgi:glycosyltransferase involved in cell wall biosynthesis